MSSFGSSYPAGATTRPLLLAQLAHQVRKAAREWTETHEHMGFKGDALVQIRRQTRADASELNAVARLITEDRIGEAFARARELDNVLFKQIPAEVWMKLENLNGGKL